MIYESMYINMKKIAERLSYIPFAIILIGIGICFLAYPTALDDYWFLYDYSCGVENSSDGSVWSGLQYFWEYRMTIDNARLANLIGVLFLLVPHWIGASISALSFILAVVLACRIAGVGIKDYNSIALMLVLMVFGLPWHDSIFSLVYSFNYIWDIPMMLGAIYLFFRDKKANVIGAVVLGAFLGAWHEIYSLPVFAGFMLLVLLRRVRLRSDRVALIIGIMAGLIWLVLSPSWGKRVDSDVDSSLSSILSFVQLLYHFAGFIPFVILTIICLCVKRWRKIATSDMVIFLMTCCVIIIAVQIMVVKARAGFPAYILSFVGNVYILRNIFPGIFTYRKSQYRWFGFVLAIMTCVHMYAADRELLRLNKELKTIEKVYDAHTENIVTIFAPITFDWELSPLALKKGTFEYHNSGWHFVCYSQYKKVPMHYLVPLRLKGYRSGMGEPLPGNAGAHIYKGLIVAPYPGDEYGINVSYDGPPRNGVLSLFRGGDGKLYCFIYPYLHTWDLFSDITDVSLYEKEKR